MAIDKVTSASITTDAVGPTQLNEASNYSFTGTVTGAGGTTAPYFFASLSANTSISEAAYVKVQFNDEEIDSNNCYDNSSNYRFTPNVAGKYYIFTHMTMYGSSNNSIHGMGVQIYKNGSRYINDDATAHDGSCWTRIHAYSGGIIDMNGSSDYVEAYAYCDTINSASVTVQGNSSQPITYFGGYKMTE